MPRGVWVGLVLVSVGGGVSGCSLNADGIGSGSTAGPADTTGTDTGSTSSSTATVSGADTTTGGADTTVLESSSGSPGGSSESSESSGEVNCEDRWWDLDWNRRRLLTIDASMVGEELMLVPIRVRLDASRIDYDAVREWGLDLRFLDEGLSELPYEVEYWDESGDSEVWVQLPVVPAGSQPMVWMYYGNAAASPGDDPTAVWDADYVSVHHLVDLTDATGQGHNGGGTTQPTEAPGMIGPGRFFDGMDHQFEIGNESDFDFTTELTVEAWAHVESFTINYQAMITKGDTSWRMHRSGTTRLLGFGSNNSGGSHDLGGATSIDDGEWHHLAIVYGSETKYVYVDGQLDDSTGHSAPISENDSTVMFGNNSDHTGRRFHGTMDEVRISRVARSADWIAFQARATQDPGVVTVGREEACP